MSDKTTATRPLDAHGKPYHRGAMVALLLVATFAGALNQTTLATAVPTLMKDFHITMSTAQQASTWFMLGNGIMIPVSAYLTLKFPTKWLYTTSYALLFIGTLTIVLTPTSNFSMFIAGRMFQAIAIGVSMPLLQIIFVEIFPPEKRGSAMGLAGLVFALAPAIGPTFAGWILNTDHHLFGFTLVASWRSVFFVPLLFIGICLVLCPIFIRDVLKNKEVKLDIPSLLLSVVGFGSFLLGFTNVATDGWTSMTTVLLPISIGIVFIAIFVVKQLHMETPFLDMRVFRIRQFTVATLANSVATMAMMGVEMMLPIYLQNVRGLSALQSGLTLLPGALMMGLIMPLAGSAYDKIGAKRLAMVGFLILAIGTLPFMFLNLSAPEHFITTVYGVRMFAVAAVMMPMMTSAMNALPREEITHGTASSNTLRQVASAVVVALLSSVTQNVTNHNMPAQSLQEANPIQFAAKSIDAALSGFHVSFALGFSFAILGLIIALFLRGGKIINMDEGGLK